MLRISMRRALCLGALLLTIAGCTASQQPFADDASIAAVSYRDPGPARLTLFTMVNNRTGNGGHSSLLINASQRVMFDPAGSFYLDRVPERKDVLFGMTPAVVQGYKSAHARSTWHVITQEIDVTPEQAELAYQLALKAGPVSQLFCANKTSNLLKSIPGFENIDVTMYPTELSAQFETLPGVRTEKYYEDDSPDLDAALAANNQALSTD